LITDEEKQCLCGLAFLFVPRCNRPWGRADNNIGEERTMTNYVWYPVIGDGKTKATQFVWSGGKINWNTGSDWAQGDTLVFQNPANFPGAIPGSGTGNSQGPGADGVGLIAGDVNAAALSPLVYTPNGTDKPFIGSHTFPVDVLINSGTVDISNLLLSQFNQYAFGETPQVPTLEVSGATLKIEGSIVNSQTVVFPTITNVPFFGTVGGTQTATGGGIIDVENGATVQVAGSVQPAITVNFTDGTLDQLNLAAPSSGQPGAFAGTIAGFVPGDTIDLTSIPFSSAYTENFLLNTLTISSGTTTMATLPVAGVYTTASFQLVPGTTGTDIVTCFMAGTRVLTPNGYVAVETLRAGDLVATCIDGEAKPVVWAGRRLVDCSRHPNSESVCPVRIAADAFEDGVPERDLYLSPDHAVFVDGVLIPVKYLINGGTIARVQRAEVAYHHVELAKHDVLLAEGLAVESYLDTGDRSAFDNGGNVVVLHPNFAARRWEAAGCAPLIVTGSRLEAVRQRLSERSTQISAGSARRWNMTA
jgi:hypothetical protein